MPKFTIEEHESGYSLLESGKRIAFLSECDEEVAQDIWRRVNDADVNTRLRAHLADPGPNVQELVLEKLGIRGIIANLKQQRDELLAAASDRSRFNLLTWCKPNPVPTCNNKYLPDVEYVVHGFEKGRLFGDMRVKSSFVVHPCGNKETSHPNEKPLPVIRKLIHLGSLPGELILDPFMGSGTTLLAAKEQGRKAIGIELEEKWCEVAAARLSQEVLAL